MEENLQPLIEHLIELRSRLVKACGLVLIVFVLLFMSAAFFPRQTMRGWFKQAARFNPLTHIVEPLRELIINQWTAGAALKALAVPAIMSVVTVSLALAALRARLNAR